MNSFIDNHATALRVLLLTVFFGVGYLEGAVFKRRDWACITWFWCLAVLTAWIVNPVTTGRICIGVVVFVTGMVLMIVYYRKTKIGKEEKI